MSALPSPSALLVGRARELAILRDRLAGAIAGHGSLVLIGGEAGIGKTTLAEVLCREAAEQGACILVGRCYDLTETPPYGPWVDLFARAQSATDPALPLAFARHGTVGAVTSQAALFQQVLDFLSKLSAQHAVVLLFDDLHWADPASLDLLRFIARSVANLPILLLVAYRSEEVTRRHLLYALLPTLVHEAVPDRLDLRPLDGAAQHVVLARRYRLGPADAARLIAYLQERTEGNPFFLGELLRTLEEEGILHPTDDSWALGDLRQVRIPPLLRQVIDGRLGRLGEEMQGLLAIAAVIGHEVALDLWMAVAECDEEVLLSLAEQGLDARVLLEGAGSDRVRFAHALIRETLYEGIPAIRRRRIHRRVGEVLAVFADPDPDAVAFHHQQAGDPRALPWLLKAADRAQRAYAWLTAADRLEAALTLMPADSSAAAERGWLLYRLAGLRFVADTVRGIALLDDALRAAEAAGERALAACARYFHGNHRYWAGDPRQGLVEIEAAVAALDALTIAERARLDARMASGVYTEAGELRPELALHLAQVGRYTEAVRMAESLVPEAERAGGAGRDGEMQYVSVYTALGEGYAALGRPAAAQQAFARARRAYAAAERYWNVGRLAYRELERVVLPYRADALTEREQLAAQAVAAWAQVGGTVPDVPPRGARVPLLYVEGGWEEARQIGNSLLVTRHLTTYQYGETMCRLLHARGEVEQAWALVHVTVPEGPGTVPGGDLFPHSLAAFRLAATLSLDTGDLTAAKEWLEADDVWLDWAGAVAGRSEEEALWARYYRQTGDAQEAYRHAQRALAHATAPRQPLALLAAHCLLGALDTDAGRCDDAKAYLEAALTLADACAAPFERALTLLALAECHRAAGDRAAAITLLAEVRAICIPLAAQPTLAKADALAARLDAMIITPPTYPAGLSAREVEVLRLIAAGQTNRQIATTLSISVKTVLNHVTHILTKTNLPNRAAAVAFAHQHDLVAR